MIFKSRQFNYFILGILFLGAILVWANLFGQPADGLLEVNFFDVGQGDSIFVETPQGHQILIDGGPDAIVLEKLGQEMSFFDREIDIVILTHPDADHLTGLIEVLKYFEVGLILTNGLSKDTAGYQEWVRLIKEKAIELRIAQQGQIINLGQGIEMRILWPVRRDSISGGPIRNTNNYSIVVQLIYNQAEFLLTGDIEKSVELILTQQDIKSDVLKIAHHGSKSSSNPLFLEKVNPKAAIISVGDNSYGHPHQEVLERLKELELYRTDKNGDIEILSNGKSLLFSCQR